MLYITETYNPNLKVISRNCIDLFWKYVLIFRCSKNYRKFTGKHLCLSLLFNKVAGLGLQLYWGRHSGAGVFLWTLQNFRENLFYKISLADYFCMLSSLYGFDPYNWTWSLTILLKFSFLTISYNIVQKEREEQTSPSGL